MSSTPCPSRKPPARIAVVTTSYPAWEGDPSGHFVQAEVEGLRRAGHEVHVVRPRPGGAFGWPGAATRLRERPVRALEAVGWAAAAARQLARLAPDRTIAHWCIPCAVPVCLAVERGLEVVSHGGDVRLLCALPSSARERVVTAALERSTRWRFVSQELRHALGAALPPRLRAWLEEVAFVAPPALVLPDVRREVHAKRQSVGERRLYVCAGRLVASKRVDRVIDYVATSGERAERVLVVLGDGPERARLERVARAWQLDVRFLGTTPRRDTLGWLGAADEVVHASRAEGLSTVLREADALGVPVTILS